MKGNKTAVFPNRCINSLIVKPMHLIIKSGIEHEFRTTVCRELIQPEDLDLIAGKLIGCRRYFLQQYRPYD